MRMKVKVTYKANIRQYYNRKWYQLWKPKRLYKEYWKIKNEIIIFSKERPINIMDSDRLHVIKIELEEFE